MISQTLQFQLTWIIVNISTDDDVQVTYALLDERYEILNLLSFILDHHDDGLKNNVIWALSNMIGEKKPDIMKAVMGKTTLLDYLAALRNA